MLTIIPHRPQHFSWDCGLVSVSMVLAGMGVPRSQPHDIYALYPVQSIWTIDLAYILRHFDVHDFTMYTSYIGVNWQNVSKHFYTDTSSDDIRRVHSLFAKARDAHVRVVPLVLSIDDIRRFLVSNRYAIIMLVNVNLLSCSLCRKLARSRTPCGIPAIAAAMNPCRRRSSAAKQAAASASAPAGNARSAHDPNSGSDTSNSSNGSNGSSSDDEEDEVEDASGSAVHIHSTNNSAHSRNNASSSAEGASGSAGSDVGAAAADEQKQPRRSISWSSVSHYVGSGVAGLAGVVTLVGGRLRMSVGALGTNRSSAPASETSKGAASDAAASSVQPHADDGDDNADDSICSMHDQTRPLLASAVKEPRYVTAATTPLTPASRPAASSSASSSAVHPAANPPPAKAPPSNTADSPISPSAASVASTASTLFFSSSLTTPSILSSLTFGALGSKPQPPTAQPPPPAAAPPAPAPAPVTTHGDISASASTPPSTPSTPIRLPNAASGSAGSASASRRMSTVGSAPTASSPTKQQQQQQQFKAQSSPRLSFLSSAPPGSTKAGNGNSSNGSGSGMASTGSGAGASSSANASATPSTSSRSQRRQSVPSGCLPMRSPLHQQRPSPSRTQTPTPTSNRAASGSSPSVLFPSTLPPPTSSPSGRNGPEPLSVPRPRSMSVSGSVAGPGSSSPSRVPRSGPTSTAFSATSAPSRSHLQSQSQSRGTDGPGPRPRSGSVSSSSSSSNAGVANSSKCLLNPFFRAAGKKGYDMIYEPEFVGHYVVLIGYDPATDMFSYRDPGTEAPLCQVSSTVLEAARMSSGTDHDLIVIKVM